MILQAYILTVLLSAVILILVVAKLFFSEFPGNKAAPASFLSNWLKYPKNKDCVEERAQGFLSFLYYLQIALLMVSAVVALLGNYTL